jgi:hypothetical protein
VQESAEEDLTKPLGMGDGCTVATKRVCEGQVQKSAGRGRGVAGVGVSGRVRVCLEDAGVACRAATQRYSQCMTTKFKPSKAIKSHQAQRRRALAVEL